VRGVCGFFGTRELKIRAILLRCQQIIVSMMVMVRTQIQLKEEDFKRLKREAGRRSCSAVMELSGKYHSGSCDLARNHDDYLDEGW